MIIEEIKKIGENCTHCGFCKTGCPMYMENREDKWSARGIWILLNKFNKDSLDELLSSWGFREVIYACTMCGNCFRRCPASIETPKAVLKLRKLFSL